MGSCECGFNLARCQPKARDLLLHQRVLLSKFEARKGAGRPSSLLAVATSYCSKSQNHPHYYSVSYLPLMT